MGKVRISDDAIWVKHIEGDAGLESRLKALAANDIIDLEIDGIVGRWQRMKDGKDGRPTFGIKPIEAMRDVWARLRQQTGRVVDIREVLTADSYLASLTGLMSEWDSPQDEAAYRDL